MKLVPPKGRRDWHWGQGVTGSGTPAAWRTIPVTHPSVPPDHANTNSIVTPGPPAVRLAPADLTALAHDFPGPRRVHPFVE